MYNLTKLNVNTYNINPLNFLLVTNDLCYVCRSYTTLFSAVYLFVLMVSTSLYLFSFLWYWALILTLGAVYLTSTVGTHTPHSTQSVFWQTPGSLHLAHTASMSRKKEERVVVRWNSWFLWSRWGATWIIYSLHAANWSCAVAAAKPSIHTLSEMMKLFLPPLGVNMFWSCPQAVFYSLSQIYTLSPLWGT